MLTSPPIEFPTTTTRPLAASSIKGASERRRNPPPLANLLAGGPAEPREIRGLKPVKGSPSADGSQFGDVTPASPNEDERRVGWPSPRPIDDRAVEVDGLHRGKFEEHVVGAYRGGRSCCLE